MGIHVYMCYSVVHIFRDPRQADFAYGLIRSDKHSSYEYSEYKVMEIRSKI